MAYKSATNPKTGETFVLMGSKWQTVKTATNPQTGETFGLVGTKWEPLGVIDYFKNLYAPKGVGAPLEGPPAGLPAMLQMPQQQKTPVAPGMIPTSEGIQAAEEVAGKGAVASEFTAGLESYLNSLPEAERAKELNVLLSQPEASPYARAAQVVAEKYKQYDIASKVPTLKDYDPRLEAQAERFAKAGMRAEDAQALAQQQAQSGAFFKAPDIAQPDPLRMEARRYGESLKDAGFLRRVGEEAKSQFTQAGLGMIQFAGDVSGQGRLTRKALQAGRVQDALQEAIPKGSNQFEQSAQQALASLAVQGPVIAAGIMTGTSAPVIAQTLLQSFGTEYGQGRRANLDPTEAATRAALISSAEGFFERYGLESQFKTLRKSLGKIPTNNLSGVLAKSIATELPAEAATTTAQFLIDKAPEIGLAPNAGMKEFLEAQAETLRQTLIQSNATVAGVYGAGKIAEALTPESTKAEYRAEQAKQRALGEWEKFGAQFRESAEKTKQRQAAERPEPKLEIGAEGTVGPAYETVEQQQRFDAVVRYHMQYGVPEKDAIAMAKAELEEETAAKEALIEGRSYPSDKIPLVPTPLTRFTTEERAEPKLGELAPMGEQPPTETKDGAYEKYMRKQNRINATAQELLDSGYTYSTEEAYRLAKQRIDEIEALEEEDAAQAQVTGEPVSVGVGVGPTVSEPTAVPPAAETAPKPKRSRVARTRKTISDLAGAEGEPSAALTEAPVEAPTAATPTAEAPAAEAPVAEAPTPTPAAPTPAAPAEAPTAPAEAPVVQAPTPVSGEQSVNKTPDQIKEELKVAAPKTADKIKLQDNDPTIEASAVFAPPAEPTLLNRRNAKDIPATERIKGLPISGGTSEGDIVDPKKRQAKFDEVNYTESKPAMTQDLAGAIESTYPAQTLGNIGVIDYGMTTWLGAHFNGGLFITTSHSKGLKENAPVVGHELGHAAHSLLGDKINKNPRVLEEFRAVEDFLYPGLRDKIAAAEGNYDNKFFNYLLSPDELIAEFNVQRLGNPEQARKVAPILTRLLQSVDNNPGLVKKRKTVPSGLFTVLPANGYFAVDGMHSMDINTYPPSEQARYYIRGEEKTKTTKNLKKAIQLLESVEDLHAFALMDLADLYEGKYGDEVKNLAKAAEVYDRLAERALPSSQETNRKKAEALREQAKQKKKEPKYTPAKGVRFVGSEGEFDVEINGKMTPVQVGKSLSIYQQYQMVYRKPTGQHVTELFTSLNDAKRRAEEIAKQLVAEQVQVGALVNDQIDGIFDLPLREGMAVVYRQKPSDVTSVNEIIEAIDHTISTEETYLIDALDAYKLQDYTDYALDAYGQRTNKALADLNVRDVLQMWVEATGVTVPEVPAKATFKDYGINTLAELKAQRGKPIADVFGAEPKKESKAGRKAATEEERAEAKKARATTSTAYKRAERKLNKAIQLLAPDEVNIFQAKSKKVVQSVERADAIAQLYAIAKAWKGGSADGVGAKAAARLAEPDITDKDRAQAKKNYEAKRAAGDEPRGIEFLSIGIKLPATIEVDGVSRSTTNSEGRPIHPTEEGVRNFWRWFGDSKVVDAEGRPLVVYHGTVHGPQAKSGLGAEAISEFSVEGLGKTKGAGAFFSSSPAIAGTYAGKQTGSAVYPVYLRLNNPLQVDAKGGSWGNLPNADVLMEDGTSSGLTLARVLGFTNAYTDGIGRRLSTTGWDSAIINNIIDIGPRARIKPEQAVGVVYIVKDPTQVKSAVGNAGEYSAHTSIVNNITNNVPPVLPPKNNRRRPSLVRAAKRLEVQRQKGWVNDQEVAAGIEEALGQIELHDRLKDPAVRARGMAHIKKRLWEAVSRGELDEGEVRFAEWLIDQNPNLVAELGISIVKAPEDGEYRGRYDQSEEIIYLTKLATTDGTTVHEILHHTERMLPAPIREALLKEWAKQLNRARRNATGAVENSFFDKLYDYHFSDKSQGEKDAQLKAALDLIREGDLPYEYYQYVHPSEFWAVNGTRIMQGRYDAIQGGLLARLKNWLREFGQKMKSLLGVSSDAHIIRAIDAILKSDGAQLSSLMLSQANAPVEARGDIMYAAIGRRTPTELDDDFQRAKDSMLTSEKGNDFRKSLGVMGTLKNPKAIADEIRYGWDALNDSARAGLAKVMTTDLLAEVNREDIPELINTIRLFQSMEGMTKQMLTAGTDLLSSLQRLTGKDAKKGRELAKATLTFTQAEYDPADSSNAYRHTEMDNMYRALGAKGQQAYALLRDYYASMRAFRTRLVRDQINNMPVNSQSRQMLRLKLQDMLQNAPNLTPYFPLHRFGQFYMKVGKGKDRQFFTYESMRERDRAIEQKAKEFYPAKSKQEALDAALQSGELGRGNSTDFYTDRSILMEGSQLLPDIFNIIDATTFTNANAKDELKDAFYQLYLEVLPEGDIRNQFKHREGIAGFSLDILRSAARAVMENASQLPKLKYAQQLRNSASQARDSIAGRSELEPYIKEMEARIANVLQPPAQGAAETIATAVNRVAFVYYLSSASSALIQPLSLIVNGLPVIGARHGMGAATAEFVKQLKFWDTLGITRKNLDGTVSYTPPTLENAKGLTPLQQRAVKELMARGVFQSTLASGMYGRPTTPSEEYGSAWEKTKKYTNITLVGLMHSTERLTREYMALVSFNLNMKAASKAALNGLPPNAPQAQVQAALDIAFEQAINETIDDANEALVNPEEYNRPPLMKTPAGRVLFLFKLFPLHVISHLGLNFHRIFNAQNRQGKKAAAYKFFGTLGMVYVFAGLNGMPFFAPVLSALAAMFAALGEDDEMPDEFRDMDFYSWFRSVYMPTVFGEAKIAGYSLKGWEDAVDRGLANKLTGIDFASRLGLSDMLYREPSPGASSREGLMNYVIAIGGPVPALALRWADSYDAFALGDYQRGWELALPAVVRNPLVAKRYNEEGVMSPTGETIVPQGDLKGMELAGQVIGFAPDIVSNTQRLAFEINKAEKKIGGEQKQLTKRLEIAIRKEDDRLLNGVVEDIYKFTLKNPGLNVTLDDFYEAVYKKREKVSTSEAGVTLTEKNFNWAAEAIEQSALRLAARQKELAEKARKEAEADLVVTKGK